MGTVTSYNIGTPSATRYYFVTAYDIANLESSESSVVTYTPPTATPVIGVNPISLSFATIQGGPNPAPQTVSISNTGSGTLSWSISDNANWLTLSPTSGTGNGAVTVNVSASGLAEGRYSASIVISATGASNVTVPVTFTISSAPPVIGVSPTSLTFAAAEGGSNPPNQTLSISNTGGGTLSWSGSDNAAWLTLSPTTGTGNGAVTVNVNAGGLAEGRYNASIIISATGASNVTVPVTFTISSAPPVIGVSPTSLTFTATQGAGSPPNQTLSISNTGGSTLSWSGSDNASWLSLSPTSGTGNGVVTVSVNTGTLAAGTYNGAITLTATGAPSVTVPVTVTVNTAPVTLRQPPTPNGLRLGWFK